ncbi:MAG: hypothetical protein KDA42_03710 [Planctomycetales bacterium]|nr:hypothetical protein [Planctomycetales bacterium]
MRAKRRIPRLVLLFVLLLVTGCASAYHDYAGCHVPCRYCSLPPLPYTQYGCACHCCAASAYLTASTTASVEQETMVDANSTE